MDDCVRRVVDCNMLLCSNNLSIDERKNNLKNVIIHFVNGSYADFDNSVNTDISMVDIVKPLEKLDTLEKRDVSFNVLSALVLGMEMIQNSHVDLIKKRGQDRLSEPTYSYDSEGNLTAITILYRTSNYKTLCQVARYFDNRFMKNINKRTLRR